MTRRPVVLALAASALLVALAWGAPLAGARPDDPLTGGRDERREQSDPDATRNATYDAVRAVEPHVPAVALPVLHCLAVCYRSLGPADDVAFSPFVERERSASVYDASGVSDRWSDGRTVAGGGAFSEEESSSETTHSIPQPNATRTDYESSYHTLAVEATLIRAEAVESEARSSTTSPNASSSAGAHELAGSAQTAGLPVGLATSGSAGHERGSFENATSTAESSSTGAVAALAFDDAQGGRTVVVASVSASSDHVGKTTLVRVQLVQPLQDGVGEELALPLVLP